MQQALVERAQAGDHDAFSELVRASYPRLLGVARLILRDPDHAQDTVQDALVTAWRHIRALRDAGAWDAWLYRLTVRACHRSARKVRKRNVVELHVTPDPGSAGVPDESMALGERDRLDRALARLPLDQRTVLVLHFYVDLPLAEAASVLGIPLGTAKSRQHRALIALRASLGTEPEARASFAQERHA